MTESGRRVVLDRIIQKAFQRRGTVVTRAEQREASEAKIFLGKQHYRKGKNKDRGVKAEMSLAWSCG